MNADICPVCGKGRLVTKTEGYETKFVDRNGVKRNFVVPELRREECVVCGEAFLDDSATRQLEAARRAAAGLLSASEIRDLRRRLDRTQAQMSRLLGIGEKTYCRWESGQYVQSVAFDNYIRVVMELPEAAQFLDELQNVGPDSAHAVTAIDPVFPSLRDVSSLKEPATIFARLLKEGGLFASRTSV